MNEPIRHPDPSRDDTPSREHPVSRDGSRASDGGRPAGGASPERAASADPGAVAGRLGHAPQLVDRDGIRRKTPGLLAALAADPRARVMRLAGGAVAVRAAEAEAAGPAELDGVIGAPMRLALEPLDAPVRAELEAALAAESAVLLYLGLATVDGPDHEAGAPIVALIDEAPAQAGPDRPASGAPARAVPSADTARELVPLRDLLGRLSALDHELATTATAMREWHRAHACSPASGDPLEIREAGWLRQDRHGTPSFPRTDPAVIAAVVDRADGDPARERILLGSNARWSRRRFSLLAGFVEPGESFEQAVEREIAEESGLRIANPRYLGSQPWPFPASIMVGFLADLHPDQDPAALVPEPGEIDELRWLTRAQLAAGAVELPPAPTIARRIIDGWLRGALR